jgi:hypothetical protein
MDPGERRVVNDVGGYSKELWIFGHSVHNDLNCIILKEDLKR